MIVCVQYAIQVNLSPTGFTYEDMLGSMFIVANVLLKVCSIASLYLDLRYSGHATPQYGVSSILERYYQLYQIDYSIDLIGCCIATSALVAHSDELVYHFGAETEIVLCCICLLATLASGVFVHSMAYDTTGTYKPAWIDKLG